MQPVPFTGSLVVMSDHHHQSLVCGDLSIKSSFWSTAAHGQELTLCMNHMPTAFAFAAFAARLNSIVLEQTKKRGLVHTGA